MRETIEVIKRIFPIRSCNRAIKEGQTPDRPCLNYYIGQCWGPCLGNVKRSDYQQMIKEVCRFLEGKQEDVLEDLRNQMQEAADNLQFEKAAALRDKIQAVEKVLENQKIMSTSLVDQDIVAFHQEEDQTAVQIFFIRSGKLISAEHHILEDTRGENLKDIINTYLKQFYGDSAFIPREILIQVDIDDRENIEKWLTKRQGIRVHIRVPKREKNSNY